MNTATTLLTLVMLITAIAGSCLILLVFSGEIEGDLLQTISTCTGWLLMVVSSIVIGKIN